MDAGELELIRLLIREAIYGTPTGGVSFVEFLDEIRNIRDNMLTALVNTEQTNNSVIAVAAQAAETQAEIAEAISNTQDTELAEEIADKVSDELKDATEELAAELSEPETEVPIIDDNGEHHMVEVDEHEIEPERVHPLERNLFGGRRSNS